MKSFAGYVIDEQDDDNGSVTPLLSPPPSLRLNLCGGSKPEPPLFIESIHQRDPYEPPPGLYSNLESSLDSITDYRSGTNDDVEVSVHPINSSNEEAEPVYQIKSEFMPPIDHMFSFPCFTKQLQSQWREPESLKSLLVYPDDLHAAYWDIDYGYAS